MEIRAKNSFCRTMVNIGARPMIIVSEFIKQGSAEVFRACPYGIFCMKPGLGMNGVLIKMR